MKNKYKIIPWIFLSLDYKAMEEYLVEMAKSGWMLEKIRVGFAKFRAIEPKDIKFCVDVFKDGGPLSSGNTREAKVYRRKTEELGWNLITSQDYLQFFYCEEGKDVAPIQSDEEEEFKTVKRTLLKQNFVSVAFLLFLSYQIVTSSYHIRYTNLLNYIGVFITFMYPIFGLTTIFLATYSLTWLFRNSRKIKKGLPMERPTLRNSKIRGMLMNGLACIVLGIFILASIMDITISTKITLFALLGPTIGIITGFSIRYLIKKRSKEKGDSILYIIVGIISVVLVLNIGLSFYIRSTSNSGNYINDMPEGYPIVTLKEINVEVNDGSLESRTFDPGKSPIVPMHYYYWEAWNINGKSESMSISYYKVINPYFTEVVFSGKSEEIKRVLSWRRVALIEDDEIKDLYNADNVLISENKDIILIQKGNIVVHLRGDINFYEDRVIELITHKLLK